MANIGRNSNGRRKELGQTLDKTTTDIERNDNGHWTKRQQTSNKKAMDVGWNSDGHWTKQRNGTNDNCDELHQQRHYRTVHIMSSGVDLVL